MKISIITVCFNSSATIARAISSVQSQTYPDIEHIIVDGDSKDGTVDIINKLSNSKTVVRSEPDQGIYDAMSKGLALATGDVVGVLNSDDYYANEHCVAKVVEAFKQHAQASMVFGDVVFVGADSKDITRFYSSAHFRPWKLRFGWMPPHPATFVRKSVYERFGGYKINYKISADYERFVKWLMVEKLPYLRIDQVLVVMQEGGVSTRSLASRLVLNQEIVKACRENGVYTNMALLLLKIPFKLLELVRRPAESH